MAYNLVANGEDKAQGVKEYVVDTIEDLAKLPKKPMGCVAFVVNTSQVFMLNGSQEWKEV